MDKEYIKNEALKRFRSGFNCSQSVLSSLAGELDVDASLLEKVSSGFGGGMGHMQGTCGAVTGSFMAISLYCGSKYADNDRRTTEAYSMIKKFDAEFKELHASTICKDLIKYELDSEEGHQKLVNNNVFELVCEKCIADSIEILSRLIE